MSLPRSDDQKEVSGDQSVANLSSETSIPDIQEDSDLRQVLEEKQAKIEQLLGNWQRAEADISNLRKRMEHDQQEIVRYANATLIANILPIIDDFERALKSVEKTLEGFTWIDGIRMIYYRTLHILESQGLKAVEALGKQFDPHEHEAILYGEGKEGQVLEELQKGYKLHERVLRPTMVKVGRQTKNEEKT